MRWDPLDVVQEQIARVVTLASLVGIHLAQEANGNARIKLSASLCVKSRARTATALMAIYITTEPHNRSLTLDLASLRSSPLLMPSGNNDTQGREHALSASGLVARLTSESLVVSVRLRND